MFSFSSGAQSWFDHTSKIGVMMHQNEELVCPSRVQCPTLPGSCCPPDWADGTSQLVPADGSAVSPKPRLSQVCSRWHLSRHHVTKVWNRSTRGYAIASCSEPCDMMSPPRGYTFVYRLAFGLGGILAGQESPLFYLFFWKPKMSPVPIPTHSSRELWPAQR